MYKEKERKKKTHNNNREAACWIAHFLVFHGDQDKKVVEKEKKKIGEPADMKLTIFRCRIKTTKYIKKLSTLHILSHLFPQTYLPFL